MVFFKRLSRNSRSNSYVDDPYTDEPSTPRSPNTAAKFDRYDSARETRPDSQRQDNQHNVHSSQDLSFQQEKAYASPPSSAGNAMYRASHGGPTQQDMYHQQMQQQQLQQPGSRAVSGATMANGSGNLPIHTSQSKFEPAPDLLTQAFNAAVRPYTDKIAQLEAELAELRSQLDGAEGEREELKGYLDTMEGERSEVFGWIDKRGLRPDVPPTIARAMDASNPEAAHLAAQTLSAQLDRKITIVNFDLHRLQDDLNDSISTAHFAASMLKFLPDIQRLSSLPTGAKPAFDLVLKLGGNLNSHGGLDSTSTEDVTARQGFFSRLDDALVGVVERRFEEEGQDWGVQKEIRRLEKTREYLRQFGVEPYFPKSLDMMKSEAGAVPGGAAPGYHSDNNQSGSVNQQLNGATGYGHGLPPVQQNGTPPKY